MTPRWLVRHCRVLAAPLTLVLAAALAVGPPGTAAAAPDPTTPDATIDPGLAGAEVTLVTGDRVQINRAGGDRLAVMVEPAAREGEPPAFEKVDDGDGLYVIPSDAAALIPERLDRELFNVTKLVRYGYTGAVPVIVTGRPGQPAAAARTAATGLAGATELPSVDGYAATVPPDGGWWRSVAPAGNAGTIASRALAGGRKVWLDEVAAVTLDESVPMVGAPQAWAAGYDGTGATVAVLDTGIDETHPDLAGKVAQVENFVAGEDATDRNGHGTHVASTIAGSGAAADGRYQGVAPGAQLLSGKICNAAGNCPNSGILAAMEWAAPLADVVSMSIGTNSSSDGTDPMSLAVNTLTDQHDTLFVVAAGNRGVTGPGSISAPGAADAALTVGSVDKTGQIASTSGHGPRLGDFAIKPDITAPGVAITAARATGTSPGNPVGDFYAELSGTSMATPHASAAAAIVLQRDPDLTAAQLKAALANGAAPSNELTVYQQGGGLLDVPAALEAPIVATPSPLDFGSFAAGDQSPGKPVTAEVTFTNRGTASASLDLSLELRDADGAALPGELSSVDPANLTIEPDASATATVSVDIDAAGVGQYGGHLSATGAGADLTIPVGFHKEAPRYRLTVEGTARDGRAAVGSSLRIINVHDTRVYKDSVRFLNGVATADVPAGTYLVMGYIWTYDGNYRYRQDLSVVGVAELVVDGDTSLTLDAREATPVRFETPRHPDAVPYDTSMIAFYRQAADHGFLDYGLISDWTPTYVMATDPVTVGEFEYLTRARVMASPLDLAVVGDDGDTELTPRLMLGSAPVDGTRTLPLAWAGFGAEEDYAGIDVQGAAVLTMLGGPGIADKEAIARAHGAAALLVMNNTTGNLSGYAGTAAELPAAGLSGEEGELLRDLLAGVEKGAEVTLRMSGTSVSPYLYDLQFPEPDRIPETLDYVADRRNLATLENAYHGEPGTELHDSRLTWRPYQNTSLYTFSSMAGPQVRTEYVVADDTRFSQAVAVDEVHTVIAEPMTRYRVGESRSRNWLQGPLRPGLYEPNAYQSGNPVVRSGDDLTVQLAEWTDSAGNGGNRYFATDTTALRLFQDGELVAEADRLRGTFPLSPEPTTYRLEADTTRTADWWPTSTASRTVWTVPSRQPADGGTEVLPLLLVDYDAHLDLANTAPWQLLPTVDLTVRHQPGADSGRLRHPALSVSYDGERWSPAAVIPRGGGRYTALLPPTFFLPPEVEFASLRVDVADHAGNRFQQEITNAWRLPGR